MENVILFVSDRESFIIKSIIKNLRAKNQPCDFCVLNESAIQQKIDSGGGIIYLYIDDFNTLNKKGCMALKDLYVNRNYDVYLMGNANDIQTIKEEVFAGGVSGEYYRPINVNEITEKILETVNRENADELRKHVLVVDDSGTMLTTIKSWLEDKYRVSMVNSAMNAIAFLSVQTPDLILLDYEMPACSGAQFLEMMRQDTKNGDVPVIFLTGHDDAATVKSVLELKPEGYLLKSRPKEEIVTKVDEFFRKKRI